MTDDERILMSHGGGGGAIEVGIDSGFVGDTEDVSAIDVPGNRASTSVAHSKARGNRLLTAAPIW